VSARPSVPRLEGEELDLLISRSLDGDLSPEETRDLETVLANDPAARKRKEELADLVAEARALPAPAPPFALSTRVNSNVSEKTARGGSVFHRFGFYPPPGMTIGAMVVLGVVAVAITVLNPAPKPVGSTIAQRADGPVDVFFQEGARAKDATKKAAPSESLGAKIASKEKVRDRGEAALSAPVSEPSGAPAPAARAMRSVNPRIWSVVIRGEGARRWMLRRAPESRPPAASAPAWSFRVTLDAEGRVTAVRSLDARTVQPALLEFVRGLVFAPVGSALGNAVGSVAEGFAREQRANDERTDTLSEKKADKAAENPSEIEVEVSTH
jgi:hypothetical protein